MKNKIKLSVCTVILLVSMVGCGNQKQQINSETESQDCEIETEQLEAKKDFFKDYGALFAEDEDEYMTEFSYDENHNLEKETTYSFNGDVYSSKEYRYDGNKQLIQIDVYNGTRKPLQSFLYDGQGNCIKEMNWPYTDDMGIPHLYWQVEREFGESGLAIKEEVGSGVDDGSGSTNTFEYDEEGNCIKIIGTHIGLAEIANGGQTVATRSYNSNGDLTNETITGGDWTELHNYFYEYDEDGNVIRKTYAFNHTNGAWKDVSYQYEYDSEGRLIKEISIHTSGETEEDRLIEYEYDNNGNLVKKITKSRS